MSYAKLNIWLRDLECRLRDFWKVNLVIKTCGGDYLVDFIPDVIARLKEAGYNVKDQTVTMGSEKTIEIISYPGINHIEVDVPPGCYIVRAWVCWENLWSDRLMVIVGCGEEACVNLLVPLGRKCIRDAFIPLGKLVVEQKLNPDEVRIAFKVIMQAGNIEKEALLQELDNLAKELRESEAPDAPDYVKALDFMAEQIKGIPMEPPILISPPSLDFGFDETKKSFTITNKSGENMGWRITSKQPNWIINVSPKSGSLKPGTAGTVSIEVYRQGLDVGEHHHSMSIRYNDEKGNIVTVPFMITMKVRG